MNSFNQLGLSKFCCFPFSKSSHANIHKLFFLFPGFVQFGEIAIWAKCGIVSRFHLFTDTVDNGSEKADK